MQNKDDELAYFIGFSDGVHSCNMAVLALVEGSAKIKDSTKLKLMIAHTGKVLANIMDETSERIEKLIDEKEKSK